MGPVEVQFQVLKSYYSDAALHPVGDGSFIVSIPRITLPSGWSKSQTEIRFVAPVGYPFSRPDCFWTDSDLRLANGNPPQNSGPNPTPEALRGYLWFSWHLSAWDPNSDNLLTYLNVIKKRFTQVQ
jgi:hypothetical protein